MSAVSAVVVDSPVASDEMPAPDRVGRVHFGLKPITVAGVFPYLGDSIPGWQNLGLEAKRVYQLLRPREEIEKAAKSSNSIQLLIEHLLISADDHKPDEVAGTTGTDAEYKHPFLYNTLAVWTREGIDGIEDESRKELSAAYHYVPVMESGTYEGQYFDGRMTNLEFNHICLVPRGRSGPVVAIDELPPSIKVKTETPMTKKTALLSRTGIRTVAALSVLAMDAKIDFTPVLKGVTAKNLKARTPALVKAILAVDGMEEAMAPAAAASGATPDDVIMKVLSMVEGQAAQEAPEMDEAEPSAVTDPNAGLPAATDPVPADSDDPMAKIMEFLKGKLGAEDMEALQGLMTPKAAEDEETDEEKAAREAKEKAAMDDKDEPKVDRPAMDAAIASARKAATADTMKLLGDIRDAERACAPILGEITVAMDSADAIYDAALKASGKTGAGINLAGKKALVEVLVAQKSQGGRAPVRLALDAALISDRAAFDKEHGINSRPIRHLG